MILSLDDMRKKEVIDIATGERMGFVSDVRIDIENCRAVDFAVCGKFGLLSPFGRDGVRIPFSDIKTVGEDIILVRRQQSAVNLKSGDGTISETL